MKNRSATVGDLKKMNKVIRKAKVGADESKIRYKKIDKFKNLQIHGYADASFKTQDGKTRSVEGRILFLTNGRRASPILWKSKKISRVADSTKSTETLAMDKAADDAFFIARMVHHIYTGRKTREQIPVYMFTDSRPLHDSIYSTKQVERKSMRHVIQIMKDAVS